VLPTSAAVAIGSDAILVADAELSRHVTNDTGGHRREIIDEGAEESHRAELDGEAEAHVIPTLGHGQLAVSVIKVKMARELVSTRLARIAVAALLLGV
jgi:hypothetical protein